MAQEIEKKYLLKEVPRELRCGKEICQGYIVAGDPEVRVRDKAGKYYLTRKGGEGFIREEEEVEITEEAFAILWTTTAGKRLEKIRYQVIGVDRLVWEVDVYSGALAGLVVAEVELPAATTIPIMPDSIAEVLAADVTTDKRFKNKNLAMTAEIPTV